MVAWVLPAAILDTRNPDTCASGVGVSPTERETCEGCGWAGGEKCPLTFGGEPCVAGLLHATSLLGSCIPGIPGVSCMLPPTRVPQQEPSGGLGCSFLSLIRNALAGGEEIPAGEACDCLKIVCPLPQSGGCPSPLAEVGPVMGVQ